MSTETNPYIVSSDIEGLFDSWSQKTGYVSPSYDFFNGARNDLENVLGGYFPEQVEIVHEDELRSGLISLAKNCTVPIISLDRAYVDQHTPNIVGFLDVTRMVDENFNDIGLKPRPGYPPIDVQLDSFRLGKTSPVALLDDVVFTGDGITSLAKQLAERGRPVVKLISGIGITEGMQLLRMGGVDAQCVKEYEAVIDEICQRDFVAGAPMSGRTLLDAQGRFWSAPYFNPFGDPIKWASIPEAASDDFSDFCLEQSIAIWRKIEQLSCANVPVKAIPRLIRGMSENPSISRELVNFKRNNSSSEI